MYVISVVVFALMLVYCRSTLIQYTFYASSICDIAPRISEGCTEQIMWNSVSMIGCAQHCAKNDTCIGVSLNGEGSCFIHHECQSVTGCGAVATGHRFLSKLCANGGTLEPSNNRCRCVNGWVGSTCRKYPKRCYDLRAAGNIQSLVTTKLDVYGNGSTLIPVKCRRNSNGLSYETIILYNMGQKDFNKTWAEYRDGFIIDNSHHWSGLENMHILNIGGLRTLTTVIHFNVGKSTKKNLYSFDVHGHDKVYSLSYSSISGSIYNTKGYALGNCWSETIATAFSTWDKDLDWNDRVNCAADVGSGWWFTNCEPPCNLLGWFGQDSSSKPASSIVRLVGIDMDSERENIHSIEVSLF